MSQDCFNERQQLIIRSGFKVRYVSLVEDCGQTYDRIRGKSICDTDMLALLFPLPLVKQIVYLLGKGMLFTFSKTLIVCACGAP